MSISCIAIEDEPLALKQLAAYIRKTPFLELVAECRSAFEAMKVLEQGTVQLMFVDINMPDLNGMAFVKSLPDCPFVVFTTAYSEYALEGFEVEAVDYLLKPISYAGFLKAANKVQRVVALNEAGATGAIRTTAEHLFVKSEYKLIRIPLADIMYIESMHEYVKIHRTAGKPVMTMISMKSVEAHLPTDRFMRVHRSFIVNLERITVIERFRIHFGDNESIPVSDQYKAAFQEYIDKNMVP
jgi:two-component system, LytTR family, response regulator LytT